MARRRTGGPLAVLLHDSVEDQGGKARLEDVRSRFGNRVAHVVAACSDSFADTAKGDRKADWQKRKEYYLTHLDTADADVLCVSLADKVCENQSVWSRFSQPREKTLWYYRGLADKFRERWPGQLANEPHEIVEVLENDRE